MTSIEALQQEERNMGAELLREKTENNLCAKYCKNYLALADRVIEPRNIFVASSGRVKIKRYDVLMTLRKIDLKVHIFDDSTVYGALETVCFSLSREKPLLYEKKDMVKYLTCGPWAPQPLG